MAYEVILYEKIGRVAQITFNRPEKLNALSRELRRDINAALRDANEDPEVRSIVMTGSGRAWSAGADLGSGESRGSSDLDVLLSWYNSTEAGLESTRFMRRLHKPIVAALNGYTLGAGFELAITCDLLIASEQAVLDVLRSGQISQGPAVARFERQMNKKPSDAHGISYAAMRHWLKAVETAGTVDAAKVNEAMRATPVDFYGMPGRVRADGRATYDVGLYQVKTPAESRYPFDYMKLVRWLSQDEAFRPLSESECPLVKPR